MTQPLTPDQKQPAVPFFARYLEGQNAASSSSAGGNVETKKYPSDAEDEGQKEDEKEGGEGETIETKKYPSDAEDEVPMTLKYPSDQEDA